MSERGVEQTRYVQAAMAVATQEYGLRPRRGRARRPKPFNPFGL
jgi:hypothetical protein